MDLTSSFPLFTPLFADISDQDEIPPPERVLAHYTTIDGLESILRSGEIWFSNPLFMNDLDELKGGINAGAPYFRTNENIIQALRTPERHELFIKHFDHFIAHFEAHNLLDTYVFCLSELDREDNDGKLSMWRAYSANGNGAAIVFDPEKIGKTDGSPLILARVVYGTHEERLSWLEKQASILAEILIGNEFSDENLYVPAWYLLERLKVFSLFTKHRGFREEEEWRVVYMSERDHNGLLRPMISYRNGARGIEPLLKFRLAPLDGVTSNDLTIEHIVHSILLGPSHSSPLAHRSVQRMLDLVGKSYLKDRLTTSSIPLRPS